MLATLPFKLPAIHTPKATNTTPDVDVGGYDFTIGGYGFRLATDTQFYYSKGTEPTTARRYDSSVEPGEQSLSPLPWVKSQSSFHAGAGQQNLEQGFTAFQYQQEQVEHIRFDTSIGVDVWTPGVVKRLPDCAHWTLSFAPTCSTSANIKGVDYLIVGGQGLAQIAFNSGPDAAPTVTNIDLSAYGGNSNCAVTSVATDGSNYYALINLTAPVNGEYIIIAQGLIGTNNLTPLTRYQAGDIAARGGRQNLCTNPSFKSGTTTGWTGGVIDTGFGHSDSYSLHYTHAAFNNAGVPTTVINTVDLPAVANTTYSVQFYLNAASLPAGAQIAVGATFKDGSGGSLGGSAATAAYPTGSWVPVAFRAAGPTGTASMSITIGLADSVSSGSYDFHIDDVIVEASNAEFLSYFDGDSTEPGYVFEWTGTAELSSSARLPTTPPGGVIGWAKSRLIGAIGNKVYDLSDVLNAVGNALPSPKYTNPATSWVYRAISESPRGVLIAGDNSGASPSSVLELTLDTSSGTPVLVAGATVATLPTGERVIAMQELLSSFLVLGTTLGVRVGTFDTYTGNFKYGPLSVTTTQAVQALAGRDRFVYGGFTNQQADGSTGLVALDLSMVVDAGGRLAYAPDLRPKSTDPQTGTVVGVEVLPIAGRLAWLTENGLYIEGSGPGSDGDAWLRTSRIRYDTAELKLFKLGRIHGELDHSEMTVLGIAPYGQVDNLGTFGFVANGVDPGEFRLPSGLHEWIQLEFHFDGSPCVLNSYQVKAYPAPQRQHIIMMTANCFTNEVDRFGLEVTDPQTPRQRLQNVLDLEAIGDETRLVEFTNSGAVAQLVLIDQIEFRSFSRPNVEDDFGGYITFRLRTTEN